MKLIDFQFNFETLQKNGIPQKMDPHYQVNFESFQAKKYGGNVKITMTMNGKHV